MDNMDLEMTFYFGIQKEDLSTLLKFSSLTPNQNIPVRRTFR